MTTPIADDAAPGHRQTTGKTRPAALAAAGGYLRLELSRTVRDGRYVLLAVVAPVGFYLLFSAVFGGQSSGPNTTFGLPASKEIMVAMATFGAMWAALSATAPRLARDREGGWSDYLATTPLRAGQVLAGRIIAGLLVALPAVVAVGIAAIAAHGVSLAAWQWAADLGLLWIGTLPFVALGIAIGSFASSTVAFAASTGLWFAFAALGGLWVPPGVLSPGLRHLAAALPSYNQAALGWHVTSGTAPTVTNVAVLAAWTLGLALLPLAARHGSWRAVRSGARSSSGGSGTAVELDNVVKRYGPVTAVNGLDLKIPAAQTVALLGPNGSGKTTTTSVLLGLLPPDRGHAALFGTTPRHAAARGLVGAMLQDTELMAGVSVGRLLGFVRRLYPEPLDLATRADALGVGELLRRRTDRLSGGQAQRVRFVLALVGKPTLLVLDEPTAALDVQARRDLWATLDDHTHRYGTTVLFSTHYLEEADQHAARIVLLGSGQVTADGTPAQVKAAAGPGRLVRFRLLGGDPERFATTAGVTALSADGDRVTLRTADADATVWALYPERDAIADIAVADASLEEAFLSLVAPRARDGRAG
ncbi:MAG TPA: ATP-binding cassette domain-containing protein [Streptosporangiaceae bacterium]|nr:ATP-binding cassette domain-containing protein [Streptosporangiaceae bacterium]